MGVRRISLGGGVARFAMTAVRDALLEVREQGTFSYAARALSNDEVAALTAPR